MRVFPVQKVNFRKYLVDRAPLGVHLNFCPGFSVMTGPLLINEFPPESHLGPSQALLKPRGYK